MGLNEWSNRREKKITYQGDSWILIHTKYCTGDQVKDGMICSYVAWMTKRKNLYEILTWKPEQRRSTAKLTHRWEDDI